MVGDRTQDRVPEGDPAAADEDQPARLGLFQDPRVGAGDPQRAGDPGEPARPARGGDQQGCPARARQRVQLVSVGPVQPRSHRRRPRAVARRTHPQRTGPLCRDQHGQLQQRQRVAMGLLVEGVDRGLRLPGQQGAHHRAGSGPVQGGQGQQRETGGGKGRWFAVPDRHEQRDPLPGEPSGDEQQCRCRSGVQPLSVVHHGEDRGVCAGSDEHFECPRGDGERVDRVVRRRRQRQRRGQGGGLRRWQQGQAVVQRAQQVAQAGEGELSLTVQAGDAQHGDGWAGPRPGHHLVHQRGSPDADRAADHEDAAVPAGGRRDERRHAGQLVVPGDQHGAGPRSPLAAAIVRTPPAPHHRTERRRRISSSQSVSTGGRQLARRQTCFCHIRCEASTTYPSCRLTARMGAFSSAFQVRMLLTSGRTSMTRRALAALSRSPSR